MDWRKQHDLKGVIKRTLGNTSQGLLFHCFIFLSFSIIEILLVNANLGHSIYTCIENHLNILNNKHTVHTPVAYYMYIEEFSWFKADTYRTTGHGRWELLVDIICVRKHTRISPQILNICSTQLSSKITEALVP